MSPRDQFSAMPKHLVPIVATVFVTLFLWLSAIPLLSWYEFSAHHQELADASHQWHHKDISDYSFEFGYLNFNNRPIPGPVRIHVRDSTFVAAYRIDNNASVDITGLEDVPETIEAAFALVSRHLAGHPHRIDIEYDAVLHYPARISVSHSDSRHDVATVYIRWFELVYENP